MEDNLFLVYVERINDTPNSMGFYEYEFYFSETPEIVWGPDWGEDCPAACDKEMMRPDKSTYNEIEKLNSIYMLRGISECTRFSGQDCVDGIIACCYEDISEATEYPEPIRLVFHYGETKEEVEDKLAQRHQFFSKNNNVKNTEEDGGEINNL